MATERNAAERDHEAKILAEMAVDIAQYEQLNLSGTLEAQQALDAIFGEDTRSDVDKAAGWLRETAKKIRSIGWSHTYEAQALALAARADRSALQLILPDNDDENERLVAEHDWSLHERGIGY